MSEAAETLPTIRLFAEVLEDWTAKRNQRRQKLTGHALAPIIEMARDLRGAHHESGHKALPQLLSGWMVLNEKHTRENENRGHLFNPLAFIPIGETTHSRLLGDLLNPKGSHGQGRRLLHAFLEMIEVPAPGAGDWMIAIEEGKVDLCLWRLNPASVILIENKSNYAVDQPNQLYRYWHTHIHLPHPTLDYSSDAVKQAFQILYIPPTGEKQPALHSLKRPTYLDSLGLPDTLADVRVTVKIHSFRDEIARWLDLCDALVPPENFRLRSHLQFYKELWT